MDDDELSTGREENTVPVIEEELVTGSRVVKTGSVRVRKEVERIRKLIEMPVIRDVIRVDRVPINRVVSSMPETREDGDTLVVPVVEEEIVVQKRLVLKEEIRIQRKRVKEPASKTVTVGREHATVERVDAEGNIIARPDPSSLTSPSRPLKKTRSLLD